MKSSKRQSNVRNAKRMKRKRSPKVTREFYCLESERLRCLTRIHRHCCSYCSLFLYLLKHLTCFLGTHRYPLSLPLHLLDLYFPTVKASCASLGICTLSAPFVARLGVLLCILDSFMVCDTASTPQSSSCLRTTPMALPTCVPATPTSFHLLYRVRSTTR